LQKKEYEGKKYRNIRQKKLFKRKTTVDKELQGTKDLEESKKKFLFIYLKPNDKFYKKKIFTITIKN